MVINNAVTENSKDLLALAHQLAGEFSNREQAFSNPRLFPHVRVFFRPLPFQFFADIGFYSEQVYDHDLWSPYRQGIHRLVDCGNHIYVENYALKDALWYAGAGRDRKILESIPNSAIERRYHCSMIFRRCEDGFQGAVEPGNQCLIERNNCKTYLVSEVELTENSFVSLDRGIDVNTHEQVWGSTSGPLRFNKERSFGHELSPTVLQQLQC